MFDLLLWWTGAAVWCAALLALLLAVAGIGYMAMQSGRFSVRVWRATKEIGGAPSLRRFLCFWWRRTWDPYDGISLSWPGAPGGLVRSAGRVVFWPGKEPSGE